MLTLIKRIQSQASAVTAHLSKTICMPVVGDKPAGPPSCKNPVPRGLWCLKLGNGAFEIVNDDGAAFLFYQSRKGYFRGCMRTAGGHIFNLGRVPVQQGAVMLQDGHSCLVINPDGSKVRFNREGTYSLCGSAA